LHKRLEGLTGTEEPDPQDEAGPPASAPTASTDVQAEDFPYAWYLNVVRTRITDSWDPPGERLVAGRTNQVLVRFQLHRDGSVTDLMVEGASGTPGLDASARRAVQQAQPFPPLPENYAGDVLSVGVRFTVNGGS
jgi:TonB family protein